MTQLRIAFAGWLAVAATRLRALRAPVAALPVRTGRGRIRLHRATLARGRRALPRRLRPEAAGDLRVLCSRVRGRRRDARCGSLGRASSRTIAALGAIARSARSSSRRQSGSRRRSRACVLGAPELARQRGQHRTTRRCCRSRFGAARWAARRDGVGRRRLARARRAAAPRRCCSSPVTAPIVGLRDRDRAHPGARAAVRTAALACSAALAVLAAGRVLLRVARRLGRVARRRRVEQPRVRGRRAARRLPDLPRRSRRARRSRRSGPLYAAVLAASLALRAGTAAPAPRDLAWLAGWLGASLASVAAGGYFRQHYFALALPPLALLAGVGLDAVARLALGPRPTARAAAPLAALVLLAWSVAAAGGTTGPRPESKLARIYGSNPFPEAPALGAWLAERSAEDERVFVYGSEPAAALLRRSRERQPIHLRVPAHDAAAGGGARQRRRRSRNSTRRRRASWSASSCAPRCSSSRVRRRR